MSAPPAALKMPAVFGEAKLENEAQGDAALPRRPLLFRVHAEPLLFRVVATDLHSVAWHRSLALHDLHDLRDDVGIAGSWSDFLDFLYSSLSAAGQVKLLLPAAGGLDAAKLVATKANGLPRITIALHTVAASALNDLIADFSLALYAAYKTSQEQAVTEQERVSQLMESLSSEREKNEVMQKQLEALSFLDKRKATKPKLVTDQVPSVPVVPPDSDQDIVPVQQQRSAASPSKVPPVKTTKRVTPAPRRARIRGALLQDTEANDDDE